MTLESLIEFEDTDGMPCFIDPAGDVTAVYGAGYGQPDTTYIALGTGSDRACHCVKGTPTEVLARLNGEITGEES